MAYMQPITIAPMNYEQTADAGLFHLYRNWWSLNDERKLLVELIAANQDCEIDDQRDDLISLHRQIENIENCISNTPARTVAGLAAKGRCAIHFIRPGPCMAGLLDDLEALCL